MEPLSALQPTNSCVVTCDLEAWSDAASPAWRVHRGSDVEIGASLAALVAGKSIARLDDFGGVAKSWLCEGERYLEAPPRTRGAAAVYSFTPKNKMVSEGAAMAAAAQRAGYRLLVLTSQKDGKYGKVWSLLAMLRHLDRPGLVYYEDTASVVDELKATPEGARVAVVHVLAPGFEGLPSARADRTVTQAQYQGEVLA